MDLRTLVGCALGAALATAACGSDDDVHAGPADTGGGTGEGGTSGSTGAGRSGINVPTGGDSGELGEQNIAEMRIEPEDAVITIAPGQTGAQSYRVYATMVGGGAEVDVTERSVFYVPDNWQIGGFVDNGPEFVTAEEDPRGGKLTVSATAANSDGSISEVRTGLTVRVAGTVLDPRDDGSGAFDVPANPDELFGGADPDQSRAPELVYPNDGVLLPPNLNRLEVHFRPGLDNTLFEVAFQSELTELRYFMRCGEPLNGGCLFELDQETYTYLAYGNRGAGPVKLTVRGTDESGEGVGSSAEFSLRFTEDEVNGGLYYWRVSGPSAIMRFDFGRADAQAEVFLQQDASYGQTTIPQCIGCHALSRDGSKMISSLGGQNDGRLVFLDDLATPPADMEFFDRFADGDNRIQFGSFNPDGSRFVAVYGDDGDDERKKLWMHDGDTGLRLPDESIALGFEPDHPDWSADGEMIAFSHVKANQTTSQRPGSCGIDLIRREGAGWGAPITILPQDDAVNQFNPNFVPDSSFFIYTVSDCANECDGDADATATTWAVVPEAGAIPVHLQRAGSPGVADGTNEILGDTFPRSAPFENKYEDGRVYWATIASRREAGLRSPSGKQWLWMFAFDPDLVIDGEDGSYPGFFLPFQDLETSNHIGQWTQQIVTDEPPPVPVPPPPPPPAPPPPPR